MAFIYDQHFEHLLRRAGFGARPDELDLYRRMAFTEAVERLLNYERIPDDVDGHLLESGYAQVAASNRQQGFLPNRAIADAQQRWLFRMLHTNRPLQEKMTLFWSNHFATAYSKLAGIVGQADATRYLAAKPGDRDSGGVRGQIEMLRAHALGNFETLLVEIAKDTAMLIWLDGRTNTRARPQENFGREIMELFSMGVGHFTEADVYAAARVFTGWNLTRVTAAVPYLTFFYNAAQHDTNAKTFTFAIYPDGSKTIPARGAAGGMQDGLDFIAALARSPHTAAYLARKLYRFFISEVGDVDEEFVNRVSASYFKSGYDMKVVMREVLMSRQFWDERNRFSRYAWPAEFAIRAIKDVGWTGLSLNDVRLALTNMGQTLFDPPDVNGWEAGRSWFSTGAMLARMNFASALAGNQKFALARAAADHASTPQELLSWVLDSLKTAPLSPGVTTDLMDYLRATGPWTGSQGQLQNKVAGVVHLVAGTPEYQFV
jgi:uncharacterized protein (DUF1800 family)